MALTWTNPLSTIQTMTTEATSAVSPTSYLTQDDFLELLTVQLENQDPLNPVSDTDFIAQMAQFSALQISTETNNTLVDLASTVSAQGTVSYIGKRVTVDSADGYITGDVTEVGVSDDQPYVTINGTNYNASSIISVSNISTTSNTQS